MKDQRNIARKKAFLAAYARVEGGLGTVFCILRDLSPEGARLEVGEGAEMPDRFQLQINGRKRIFWAEVSWRTGTELGVRFVNQQTAAPLGLAQAS